MLGVPKVHERVRSVQQGVDQGEDIHSVEKTGCQNIDLDTINPHFIYVRRLHWSPYSVRRLISVTSNMIGK